MPLRRKHVLSRRNPIWSIIEFKEKIGIWVWDTERLKEGGNQIKISVIYGWMGFLSSREIFNGVQKFLESLHFFVFLFGLRGRARWQVCSWWWHIQVKSKLNKLKLNFDNGKKKNFELSNSNNQGRLGELTFNEGSRLENNFSFSFFFTRRWEGDLFIIGFQ